MALTSSWIVNGGDSVNITVDNTSWLFQGANISVPPHLSEVPYVNTKIRSDCFECISASEIMGNHNQSEMVLKGSDASPHDDSELYDVPVSIIVLLSLLYGGISVAALVGNMLVLWVVTISRRMRTVTNMFIANLALADIIIGLFTIPFQFQAALLQRWNLPDFMCAFCPFVQVLSVNVSVFTLSAIAVDRYRAVLFPLSARVSKRKAGWVILSIWSVGLFLALPTELDYKVIHITDNKMSSSLTSKPFCANVGLSHYFRLYYNLGLVVLQYFFPLIIITGAYAHMATKLWGTTAPGNKEEYRDAVVIKMLALVVLLFALCWLPLQTYNFLQTLLPSINGYQYINIIWFCSHWLAMSNSCCNPFIYAIYNDKFQREFQTRLWCLRVLCNKTNEMNGHGQNYSECSDFVDKSKIRATYRFRNNRPLSHSSVYNPSSAYGCSTTRTTNVDSSRDCSHNSRHLSPSPAHFSRNGCTSRSLAVDGHPHLPCSSYSSGSSGNESVGFIDGNDYGTMFHGGRSCGRFRTNVIVNYERNGMISSVVVPSSDDRSFTDSRTGDTNKPNQIEVNFCD